MSNRSVHGAARCAACVGRVHVTMPAHHTRTGTGTCCSQLLQLGVVQASLRQTTDPFVQAPGRCGIVVNASRSTASARVSPPDQEVIGLLQSCGDVPTRSLARSREPRGPRVDDDSNRVEVTVTPGGRVDRIRFAVRADRRGRLPSCVVVVGHCEGEGCEDADWSAGLRLPRDQQQVYSCSAGAVLY